MIIVTHKTSMIEYRELYENFSYAVCLNIFKLNVFFYDVSISLLEFNPKMHPKNNAEKSYCNAFNLSTVPVLYFYIIFKPIGQLLSFLGLQ